MNEKHFVIYLSLFNVVLLNHYKFGDKRILVSRKVVQEQAINHKNRELNSFHGVDENRFFARRIKRNRRLGNSNTILFDSYDVIHDSLGLIQ